MSVKRGCTYEMVDTTHNKYPVIPRILEDRPVHYYVLNDAIRGTAFNISVAQGGTALTGADLKAAVTFLSDIELAPSGNGVTYTKDVTQDQKLTAPRRTYKRGMRKWDIDSIVVSENPLYGSIDISNAPIWTYTPSDADAQDDNY